MKRNTPFVMECVICGRVVVGYPTDRKPKQFCAACRKNSLVTMDSLLETRSTEHGTRESCVASRVSCAESNTITEVLGKTKDGRFIFGNEKPMQKESESSTNNKSEKSNGKEKVSSRRTD